MGKLIYLDNAATTKTSQTVVEAMLPYFTEYYGNASSIYSIGTKSKEAINKSRETIAATLGAKPEEIYFTAGGSESDNWALKATAEAYESKGKHIIKKLGPVEAKTLSLDEVKDTVRELVQSDKEDALYEEYLTQWKEEVKIVKHYDRVNGVK